VYATATSDSLIGQKKMIDGEQALSIESFINYGLGKKIRFKIEDIN